MLYYSLGEQSTVVPTENTSLNGSLEIEPTPTHKNNDPIKYNQDNSSMQYSFVTIESMDENDRINEEIVNITGGTNDEVDISDEMVVCEVVSKYQPQSDLVQAAVNNYPHIFIKLCDGAKTNAENEERIVNLSQFMVINELQETNHTEEEPVSQLSQMLIIIESRYSTSTQENIAQTPGPQLTNSMMDEVRANQASSMSQQLLAHEKDVLA